MARITAVGLLWVALGIGRLVGQDLHYTQFFAAPLVQDPALSGAFDGDIRLGSIVREQWRRVPVPYRTFSAFFDNKVSKYRLGPGALAWGAVFQHDKAGDSKLSWTQLGLRAAYRQPLSEDWQLAAGFGIDLGQRAFDPVQLQFADQYNGEFFDPSMATLERFDRTAAGFMSFSAGLGAYYQPKDSRARLWAGFSAFHLNDPAIGFFDGSSIPRPRLFKAYAAGDIPLSDLLDLALWGQAQLQGAYRETALGAGIRYYLDVDKSDAPLALMAGLGYRLGDALQGFAQARYDRWQLGLSYDVNTSGFRAATAGRGGPELSIQYLIFRVHPPEVFKSCPIF